MPGGDDRIAEAAPVRRLPRRRCGTSLLATDAYIAECINQLVLEIQLPTKPSTQCLISNSKQQVDDFVGELTL